ncbi:hypothetical protein HMPREF3037_01447 [Candidatus Stoquefichus sp. KLE1796]|nr:hypothetical protein HMPREF3037_01447 [Candidatus Stoquefichus sp. KLE1796]
MSSILECLLLSLLSWGLFNILFRSIKLKELMKMFLGHKKIFHVLTFKMSLL